MLLFSFLNGVQVIGVTQWALTGRLIGWLVILGYLSIGVLINKYMGKLGVFRSIDTLISTAIVIIIFTTLMRWVAINGWFDPGPITLNFEGFSGNRNSFAFQLLCCSMLLMSYSRNPNGGKRINTFFISIDKENFIAIANGFLLAGIVFTGSIAGFFTGIIMIIGFTLGGFINTKLVVKSVIFCVILWILFEMVFVDSNIPFSTYKLVESIDGSSNTERWKTITLGFQMWRESFWFGAGLGVFIEKSPQWFNKPVVIHSTPVWVLAEFGIIGFTILASQIYWVVSTLYNRFPLKANHRTIIILITMISIFGMVHEMFYQRIFWLILGICLSESRNNKVEIQETKIITDKV